ncbi:hypothetical protein EWB00_008048 [Schistosoma japonicum]|uniref:Uncharacterized protein n=1 Tax=Schistosoma japonicum TaxID=6182 RepID=A0A4Z2CRU4_SCHJA|nr:hypothetical protein EWB00_008048 [Schistosoma japonicum]TNN06957.1 hypothetical protein EWB00_008048 [Schistosoma japonicum]
MAEVLLKRPVDPIDYLGRCLKNHIRVRDAEMKESIGNNNELIGLDHFNECETSPECKSDEIKSDITRSSNDSNKNQLNELLVNADKHVDNGDDDDDDDNEKEEEEENKEDKDYLQVDPNNSVKEILHEGDNEEIDQNILKFNNQTDDEVTFESQTEQNLNETPTLDDHGQLIVNEVISSAIEEIIDHDDGETEEVTDSELQ